MKDFIEDRLKEFDDEFEVALSQNDAIGLWEEEIKTFLRESLLSYQDKVIEEIDRQTADEISASEGVETVKLSRNISARLAGSHKPTWIAAEIYNQALSDIKQAIKNIK